jgi:hypothetical protein
MDDIGFGRGFRPGPHPGEGGVGYVLEKAEVVRQMVRSKPIRNFAGAFMKALSDDWKSPRSSEPPKREKPRPAVQDLLFEEPVTSS